MRWRLLLDDADDGARNMAIDETLLETAATGDAAVAPSLRLYRFSPATLSLGKHQPPGSGYDLRFVRERGLGLVRRPTGGLSVLHEEDELTFSVAAPLGVAPFEGGVVATYRVVAGALVEALSACGIDARDGGEGDDVDPRRARDAVCFEARSHHEIVVDGRKLVGAAQVRRRRAFLQHGSIPWTLDRDRLRRAVGERREPSHGIGIREVAGPAVDREAVARAIVAAFESRLGATFEPGGLDARERERVEQLRAWKYDSASWTFEGRVGRRERRWGPPLT